MNLIKATTPFYICVFIYMYRFKQTEIIIFIIQFLLYLKFFSPAQIEFDL